jgi:hypothetical protein
MELLKIIMRDGVNKAFLYPEGFSKTVFLFFDVRGATAVIRTTPGDRIVFPGFLI